MKIQHFILTSVMMIGGVAAYASGTFRLDSGKGCAVLNTENAALIRLETEDGEIPFSTVAQGIWSATFADGKKISAKDFKPAQITSSRKGNKAEYTFGNEQIKVVLLLAAGNGFMDISAEVTPLQKDIKEFSLPGKIRFQSGMVEGITTQNNWPRNVGMTFNKKFFESRLNAPGLRWKRGSVIGGGLYAAVFDGRPAINLFPSRKLSTPEITQQGRAWLGEDFAAKLAGSKVFATRPFNTDQAKIVLADTPDGVFLGGQQYGSKGYCFRIGGYFQDKDKAFRR